MRKIRQKIILALFFLSVVGLAPVSPAQAADMRHRLEEHLVEGYISASIGYYFKEEGLSGTNNYWSPQLGVGWSFPGSGFARLLSWGLELKIGEVHSSVLDPGLGLQFNPGALFEIPIGNLQLFMRLGAILQALEMPNNGVSLDFLFGWYSRPISWRAGFGYDIYADNRAFVGLRFELLWLGYDPIP